MDGLDTDDLLKIAIRGYKAEQTKIQEKRDKKNTPKTELKTQSDTSKDLETRLFFIENEEARPHKDEFLRVREQYPELSFDDALELAKTRTPKESKTVKE